ncbi:MAG: hypothetical protein HQL67_07655 [Magnetococcales bacterium]|nr:hypothetical protein [Magnetococcales bacterium]
MTVESDNLEKEYLTNQRQRLNGALIHFRQTHAHIPLFLETLYLFHWLHREISPTYRPILLSLSGLAPDPLQPVLLADSDSSDVIQALLIYWRQNPDATHPHHLSVGSWLSCHENQTDLGSQKLLELWQASGLFQHSHSALVREIQIHQKQIGESVGAEEDRQRMALVDSLPKRFAAVSRFGKMGLIPRMACPQNCRHCMFVWRPPLKNLPDPAPLLRCVNRRTENLLFTGGDLSHHLKELHRAIGEMDRIQHFAILLNGAAAGSQWEAKQIFDSIRQALDNRPGHFSPAQVSLQISFDEYHQEILSRDDGRLRERIPVVNMAHLLIESLHHADIDCLLLHKQNRLNFSKNLFNFGVFSRLSKTLSRLGYPIEQIQWQTAPRPKVDPIQTDQKKGVIREVQFTLQGYPQHPLLLMSSSIDAYGRAALLNPSEYINERAYLTQVLEKGPPPGECFDIDPMIWYDGSVTLFSAAHIWMGNLIEEGESLFERYEKDPLAAALAAFDPKLLAYYSERSDDLEDLKNQATGPHHLFHKLTESAPMRLYLTKRLMA